MAIATALVESTIHIYASSVVAGSEDCDDFDEGFIGQFDALILQRAVFDLIFISSLLRQ